MDFKICTTQIMLYMNLHYTSNVVHHLQKNSFHTELKVITIIQNTKNAMELVKHLADHHVKKMTDLKAMNGCITSQAISIC